MTGPAAIPPVLADFAWHLRFRSWSPFHLAVLVLLAVSVYAACRIGLRLRDTPGRGEAIFRRAWAWSAIAFQLYASIWWVLPAHYDTDRSIPLHLCRLMAFIAPLALLGENRLLRALLYFWGLGLSSQALITPIYTEGFAHFAFWTFWLGHLQIVGSAVYDLVVRRYRPTAREFALVTLLGLAYVAFVVPINLAFDIDMGFLGRQRGRSKSFDDYLPPWPWRPVLVYSAAQLMVTCLYLVRRPQRPPPSFTETPAPQRPARRLGAPPAARRHARPHRSRAPSR